MGPTIEFTLHTDEGAQTRAVQVRRAIVAGWTGRDADAMEKHIQELAELGVPRPARTPIFYRVSANRITTAPTLEAIGSDSSGEVEFFLIDIDGELWIGAGSDHTDRKAETHGVTLSKQMCDKPIATDLWRLSDVAGHWDSLTLQSHVGPESNPVTYQDGPVTAMLAPDDLMGRFAKEDSEGGLSNGDLMFCGTLPAIGGVRASARFAFRLFDPVLNRSIEHNYKIVELPIEG